MGSLTVMVGAVVSAVGGGGGGGGAGPAVGGFAALTLLTIAKKTAVPMQGRIQERVVFWMFILPVPISLHSAPMQSLVVSLQRDLFISMPNFPGAVHFKSLLPIAKLQIAFSMYARQVVTTRLWPRWASISKLRE